MTSYIYFEKGVTILYRKRSALWRHWYKY